ncbi:MAG: threonine--tRNA ligase, partial [Proteobacteria bacterium]|nr:threonine--tRNA ligase [Pseudomonadota bacterium]
YEQSGELAGLLRVRCMTMNDAHIYCTPEQAKEEFIKVMNLHTEYYKLFGLSDFWIRFSLAEEKTGKFVDEPELWQKAEKLVREAMDEVGIPYQEVRGEAAFYGPKIDFQVTNVVGREETASTNQLDLVIGKRFDLTYIGSDNEEHTPIIIHRAPLGTHERFVAFLIEHYGGAFPTWLAPVQVRVIPVASAFNEYANSLNESLFGSFVRTEIDDSNDSFSKKIRSSAITKIPNLLIVGENEQADKTVTWQRYGSKERQTLAFDAFMPLLKEEILQRRDWRRAEQA